MLTVTIELKVHHDDPRKDAVILKIARAIAKQLVSQAGMIADGYKPRIKVMAGDTNNAPIEIMLFDKDGNELDTDINPSHKPGDFGLAAVTMNKLMEQFEE